jgi:hypothetical protein
MDLLAAPQAPREVRRLDGADDLAPSGPHEAIAREKARSLGRTHGIDEGDGGPLGPLRPLDPGVRLALGDAAPEGEDGEPGEEHGREAEQHPTPTLSAATHDVPSLAPRTPARSRR